jgi:hypothetical protein
VTRYGYVECRACGAKIHGDLGGSGRQRQYCGAACRKAAQRARARDPGGWARDQAARDRRDRNRLKRQAKQEREQQTWMDEFERGARRLAVLSDAEFEAMAGRARGLSQSERDEGERLLSDKKTRGLLLLALASASEEEAASALAAARRRHQRSG